MKDSFNYKFYPLILKPTKGRASFRKKLAPACSSLLSRDLAYLWPTVSSKYLLLIRLIMTIDQCTNCTHTLVNNHNAGVLSALRPCPFLLLSMSLLGGRFFVPSYCLMVATFDDKHVKTRFSRRVTVSISEASSHSLSAVR